MSGCVFLWSCTSEYTPRRKAPPFASGKRLTLKLSLYPHILPPTHALPYGKWRWCDTSSCLPFWKGEVSRSDGGDKSKSAKIPSLVIIFCPYEMRSSFGRDSSDGYCVAFAQSLGHVLIAYTPVGLYAGSLSRPRLMPETSVIPAYSKFGDRNFAPSGQRGRRDLAAYAARTRLSLR